MAITIKHAKTDTISDWTQADLDQQIAAGNYPPGTTLADIVLPSDWNNDHTFSGVAASGANSDITSLSGLTGGISTPKYLQLDTTATESIAVGKFRWNTATATASFGIVDGTDEINIGEQLFAYVTNADSVTITRGQPVYLFGATGNRASVKLASNLGDATSAKTLGLVAQDSIAPNATGFVIAQGQLSKVDTSAYTAGDTLYLGATAGTLTTTKPKAPNHLVYIGVVERSNAGNGQIYVRAQNGYELDEIHDVQITSPTTGQTIVWDNATSLWKNSNAVVMSGGSVDNSPIGATTASTGKFTSVTTPSVTATTDNLTLSAISTGAIKFQTAGGLQAQINDTASAARYVGISGGSSSGSPNIVASAGALVLSGGSSQGVAVYSNGYAQAQFNVAHTASAVNYVQVTGGATGSFPVISAQGSDSAIGLNFSSKSTGRINFYNQSGTSSRHVSIGGNGTTAVNYIDLNGTTTTNAPVYSVAGTDTNISMAFQPKGTGAIDLAAGSSGVNISNGGTVTALTVTANGGSYTSVPSVAITAPTTAGGVQATASANMLIAGSSLAGGGTGYTVNDTLTVVGGTFTSAATLTVTGVSAGVITTYSIAFAGTYSVLPTSPVSVTGGTGTGATFTISAWAVRSLNITVAGSGYIEQPTVSFSGGGGSGASAYATVGSPNIIRGIGGYMDFYTPNGVGFRVQDSGSTSSAYWVAYGTSGGAILRGTSASSVAIGAASAVPIQFQTNTSAEQLRVSHTASAVNYVQVTGAATGVAPVISAQGSDTNIPISLNSKGSSSVRIGANNTDYLNINTATTGINYIQSIGGSTNIDIGFIPKGTGVLSFGTYTASVLTPTGYITIKDSGGTTRRLLVG